MSRRFIPLSLAALDRPCPLLHDLLTQRVFPWSPILPIVSLVLILSVALTHALGWDTEYIDTPHCFVDMTDRCLRCDHDGNPHIVYGGDHLYHAWRDGTEWIVEIADSSRGVGQFASLAIDIAGGLHASYRGGSQAELKYANKMGHHDAWVVETVARPVSTSGDVVSVSMGTCIAVDQNQQPHICYYEEASGEVRYVRKHPRSIRWVSETVATAGPTKVCLALDGQGNPRLAYENDDSLLFAWKNGASWMIEVVDTNGVYDCASLALDNVGQPHIIYNSGPRYAHRTGSGWQTETLDGFGSGRVAHSIATDDLGQPHLVVRSVALGSSPSRLWHGWKAGTTWQWAILDQSVGGTMGTYLSAFESICLVGQAYHVSYYGNLYSQLIHRSVQGGTVVVDSSGSAGEWPSMVVDTSGGIHVAYEAMKGLRYATSAVEGWRIQTIAASPSPRSEIGLSTSLALDSRGDLGIVFASVESPRPGVESWILSYASEVGAEWQIEQIAFEAMGECAGSVSADDQEGMHVAYKIGANEKVHAEHRTSTLTTHELVDAGVNMPGYISYDRVSVSSGQRDALSVASARRESGRSFLLLASDSPTGWSVEQVDSTGWWYHAVLCYDDVNTLHLCYEGADGLRHGFRSPGGWHIETVVEGPVFWPDLRITPDGALHVAYQDKTTDDLMYAHTEGGAWVVERVDSLWGSWAFSTLAVDSDGIRHIAYYDPTTKDLKYARGFCTRMRASLLAPTSSAPLRLMRVTPCRKTIAFSLVSPDGGRVNAAVFDLLGRRVQTLHEGELTAGRHALTWDGCDGTGRAVASGTYICLAESDGWRSSVPLVLVR